MPLLPPVGKTNLLVRSFLRSNKACHGHQHSFQSANLNSNLNLNGKTCHLSTSASISTSSGKTLSSVGVGKVCTNVNVNANASMNMTTSTSGLTSMIHPVPTITPSIPSSISTISTSVIRRSFSSSIKKDKYGRLIQRRIIIRNRNKNTEVQTSKLKSKSKSKSKKKSKKWPKLPKIITPTNVHPQPIQLQTNPSPSHVIGVPPASSTSSSSLSSSLSSSSNVTNATAATTASNILKATQSNQNNKTKKRFLQWLQENSGTIILNIGSLATLTAFTRSDMLELRTLSILGSSSTIYYFLTRPPPLVKGPIMWSSIFLFTNSLMAYYILEERKGRTRQFTNVEESVYEEHFLPYGVTPRQYEKLLSIVQIVKLKRGEVLIETGQLYNDVYLVTEGSTYGMTSLSRRVTAASSVKGNKDKLSGGDAGAWIGELSFLEILGRKMDKSSNKNTKNNTNINTNTTIINIGKGTNNDTNNNTNTDDNNNNNNNKGDVQTLATASSNEKQLPSTQTNQQHQHQQHQQFKKLQKQSSTPIKTTSTGKALLTYIANQDSILYKWNFDELADLLQKSSPELRQAVTRAMTAAVVNKVVNLYISKEQDVKENSSDSTLWRRWMKGMNDSTDKIQNEDDKDDNISHSSSSSKSNININRNSAISQKQKRQTLRPGIVRLNVVQQDD